MMAGKQGALPVAWMGTLAGGGPISLDPGLGADSATGLAGDLLAGLVAPGLTTGVDLEATASVALGLVANVAWPAGSGSRPDAGVAPGTAWMAAASAAASRPRLLGVALLLVRGVGEAAAEAIRWRARKLPPRAVEVRAGVSLAALTGVEEGPTVRAIVKSSGVRDVTLRLELG